MTRNSLNMKRILTSLVIALCLMCITDGAELTVSIVTNGSYSILVNNQTWLISSDAGVINDGKHFTTEDKSLKLVNTSARSGTDRWGLWQTIDFTYQAGQLFVMYTIKTYTDPDRPIVIFSQRYLGNATGTSAGDAEDLISRFPSFKLGTPGADLGVMAYGDDMAGWDGLTFSNWSPTVYVPTGIKGGPLVLFDEKDNAMVISPMNRFMAASSHIQFLRDISWGVMGLVDSVPDNYSIDFILYFSDMGINEAVRQWGEFLQEEHNKTSKYRDSDITLQYMGYWTDNGAYYYYNTEPNKNYEQTMIDVVNYINQEKIPFRYLQYDSWWYPKGHREGTLTWIPKKEIFPDGFQYLAEKTKLPFGCHNRYWDSDTTYASYNGGKYNFIPDKYFGVAVPDDPQFWLDLFNETQQWGKFIMYEQDWMNWENDQNTILLSDLYMGRRWLMDMGNAAEKFAITIQYCMAYPRHILQSLEIPVVTQARVSEDYSPDGRQWPIGISSLFADAVNLAPSKDTFWTTDHEPGNPYDGFEDNILIQNLIATLSTGPVGPGDGIGYINKTLLMRCCDASGRILKPDRAATAINDQIKWKVFKMKSGPAGEIYTTYSNISYNFFGIVLAPEVEDTYSLTPSAGWSRFPYVPSVAYSGTELMMPVPFSESQPIELTFKCFTIQPCLYYTSPLLTIPGKTQRVAFMGEPDKWVRLSSKRFNSIVYTESDIKVGLTVQAGEVVTFNYWLEGVMAIHTIKCDNSGGSSGARQMEILVDKGVCDFVN